MNNFATSKQQKERFFISRESIAPNIAAYSHRTQNCSEYLVDLEIIEICCLISGGGGGGGFGGGGFRGRGGSGGKTLITHFTQFDRIVHCRVSNVK